MDNFLFLPRALAAALYDAAFAAAFGMVLAELWLGRDVEPALRTYLRRASLLCAFAMLVALCAQAYLATATMVASAAYAEVRSQLKTVLTETHQGRNIFTTGKMTLLLLLALASRSYKRPRARPWVLLAMLTLFAAVRSSSGHAAADGDFKLPEYVQFIHLTSIAIWSGGVIAGGMLPALLRRQLLEAIPTFTRKLSTTVTVALLLVILSGIYNSYRGLGGSIKPLASTQWGYLLDAKTILVLAAIAMGALNRRMLHANPTLTEQQSARLTAVLRAEAVVMLLILTVSAFLANSPPADAMTM
jgi:putative copper resistance protein D